MQSIELVINHCLKKTNSKKKSPHVILEIYSVHKKCTKNKLKTATVLRLSCISFIGPYSCHSLLFFSITSRDVLLFFLNYTDFIPSIQDSSFFKTTEVTFYLSCYQKNINGVQTRKCHTCATVQYTHFHLHSAIIIFVGIFFHFHECVHSPGYTAEQAHRHTVYECRFCDFLPAVPSHRMPSYSPLEVKKLHYREFLSLWGRHCRSRYVRSCISNFCCSFKLISEHELIILQSKPISSPLNPLPTTLQQHQRQTYNKTLVLIMLRVIIISLWQT